MKFDESKAFVHQPTQANAEKDELIAELLAKQNLLGNTGETCMATQEGPRARDQGQGPGLGTRGQGPGARDQGPGTSGQGPGTSSL